MSNVQDSCGAAIVGGGLVGSILAVFLQQRGIQTHMYEKRPDMRAKELDGGRSINLVVTSRGIHALKQVSLLEPILALSTPVYGRMIHDIKGNLTYQSYSKDDTDCNYSISRAELNKAMLSHAEEAGAKIQFEHALEEFDLATGRLSFNTPKGKKEISAKQVFGTDGAGSAVRRSMATQGCVQDSTDFLEHGYKELLFPAGADGSYLIEQHALHIWPRGSHMLMALPNLDGSFTVTLYLANKGELSFSSLEAAGSKGIKSFFRTYYPDAIPLLPDLETAFFANPTGILGTVRCQPWHAEDKAVLLGDAAHAVVPFFGQGMNAGFENASVLIELLDQSKGDIASAFAAYSKRQKPHGDAIADMAIDNFIEMRDRVGDPIFLLQKEVEALIGRSFPTLYLSRYSMVTHSLIPYAIAQQAGLIQQKLLKTLCSGITKAEELDLDWAETIIREQWTPFVQEHQLAW